MPPLLYRGGGYPLRLYIRKICAADDPVPQRSYMVLSESFKQSDPYTQDYIIRIKKHTYRKKIPAGVLFYGLMLKYI